MILRISILIVFVAAIAGCAWYLLRDTPEKEVKRLRSEVFKLIQDGELDRADEITDRILDIFPKSVQDRLLVARISERRGTVEGWNEALKTYAEIAAEVGENGTSLQLQRARILRNLGRHAEARGICLSVVDQLPYKATLELGFLALDSLNIAEALAHFRRAEIDFSSGDKERIAQASFAASGAYGQLLALATVRKPDEAEKVREAYRQSLLRARTNIEEALGRRPLEVYSPWFAQVCGELHRNRKDKETPYLYGAKALSARIAESGAKQTNHRVLLQAGALLMRAAWDESDDAAEPAAPLRESANEFFKLALNETSVEAAATLISSVETDSEDEAVDSSARDKLRSEYLVNLVGLCRFYLSSEEHARLLSDDSDLQLSTRVQQGQASPEADVAEVFTLIQGLAQLRAGREAEAKAGLEKYVRSELRPTSLTALEIAEQVLTFVPNSKIAFGYVDVSDAAAKSPFDYLTRRVRLFVQCQRVPELADEASRRLDKAIAASSAAAKTVVQHFLIARILANVKDYDAVIAHFEGAIRDRPDDRQLRSLYARILIDDSRKRPAGTVRSEQLSKALAHFTDSYIDDPTNTEVAQTAQSILGELSSPVVTIRSVIDQRFARTAADVRQSFALSLTALLKADYAEVVRSTPNDKSLDPLASYVGGMGRLQLSGQARFDGDEKTSKELRDDAKEWFSRASHYHPNQLELINLELAALDRSTDVPSLLLERIARLTKEPNAGHSAHWLQGRALLHRYGALRDSSDSERLSEIIKPARAALRATIRANPRFVQAYLQLARTFLLTDHVPGLNQPLVADLDRSIKLLLSTPSRDGAVLNQLAAAMELTPNPERALPYLVTLCLSRPTPQQFTRIVSSYLSREQFDKAELILGIEKNPVPPNEDQIAYAQDLERLLASADAASGSALLPLATRGLSSRTHEREILQAVAKRCSARVENFKALREQLLGEYFARRFLTSAAGQRHLLRTKAIEHYQRSVEIYQNAQKPTPLELLNNIAWYMIDSSDNTYYVDGLEFARQAVAIASDLKRFPSVHDTYGYALFRNQDFEAARSVLEKVIAQDQKEPSYRFHLASTLKAMGELEAALTHLEVAESSQAAFAEKEAALQLGREIRQEIRERQTAKAP